MTTPVIITAYTLRDLIQCERRVWLNRHGDPAEKDDVPQGAAMLGHEHERAVRAAMFGEATPVPVTGWTEMLAATRTLIADGAAGIGGAALDRPFPFDPAVIVRGRIDWLRRVNQPSRFGRWSYEPVEIKQREQADAADLLQLDLYIWLLKEVLGGEPSGWLWLGRNDDGEPAQTIEHTYDEARLFTAFERAWSVLRAESPPPVFIASHCKTCVWQSLCTRSAAESLDISLLHGIRSDTRQHFREAGIRTMAQVAALTPEDLRRFRGIKSKARGVHAHARAYVENRPVWYNPLPRVCHQAGIMFDLETNPATGDPWSLGWSDAAGDYILLVAPPQDTAGLTLSNGTQVTFVPDVITAWREFAARIGDAPVIYHWSGFDAGVMRATAPEDARLLLDARMHDLLRSFNQTVRLPVKSSSLKVVAAWLGFSWSGYEDWWQALQDYRGWLRSGDVSVLEQACAYQRDDVVALGIVWRWLVEESR